MNLGEIRSWFIEVSGRDDLVNTDDSDNGANKYINAGQRMLDRKIDFRKSSGIVFESLAIDSWYFKLSDCRSLDYVWINTSEERWMLERKDLGWLHKEFPDTIADTDSGDPVYWAPAMLRGIDITDMNDQASFFNYVLEEILNEDQTGLVILPPPDEAVTVELWGKFYSPTLVDDADSSYWSEVVPETLVRSSLYQLETMYRNTEGANDYLLTVGRDLEDIDKDIVHEDNTNVSALEG